ncbi:MAG: MFS transporter [Candidatus Hermodarchaeota archaeon]
MPKNEDKDTEIPLFNLLWPIYILTGLFSMGFSGIYILVVPLSSLFWPGEPFHALEMGILITSMLWGVSLSGMIFGRFIDSHKVNRIRILFMVAIFRGFCLIMLSFATVGKGMETWWYFYLFSTIYSLFGGGNYPNVASLSHDIVPKKQRSRFFGIHSIFRNSFQLIGFVISGLLIQIGYWRIFFICNGLALIILGVIMIIKIPEPKRGAQRDELTHILADGSIQYDFKIDKKMMKKTMLSKTNLVALVEGIFTSVFLGSLTILILPYLQTPPHNISPFATGVFLAIFGLSGGLIGQILLARLSDKLANEKIIVRLYFMILALIIGSISFVFIFFLPLPKLSIEEGKDLSLLFSFPVIWTFGIIHLSSRAISSLYEINQPPVLQEINLPEAQGQIVAWNRLLESIGFGAGPLIAGFLIFFTGYDYQLIALLIGIIAIPGIILWFLALRYFEEDHRIIKEILAERAEILESRLKNKKKI